MGEEHAQSDDETTPHHKLTHTGLPGYFPVLETTYLKVKKEVKARAACHYRMAVGFSESAILPTVKGHSHILSMKGSETMATWACR